VEERVEAEIAVMSHDNLAVVARSQLGKERRRNDETTR
jgi:hypothetical protein